MLEYILWVLIQAQLICWWDTCVMNAYLDRGIEVYYYFILHGIARLINIIY